MKKQTTKVPESQQPPKNPAVEKGAFIDPVFIISESKQNTKKHKQELVEVLRGSTGGPPSGPTNGLESRLENVQIATVESIHDHEITFINGKHSYTINTDLLPPEMCAKLKPGDQFPLNQEWSIDEVWTDLFELYQQWIKPYLTVSAGDDKEFVVNEGFVSHYNSKNNPVIWSDKRFNTVDESYFEEKYVPKIWQGVLLSFGKWKHIPEFTIFAISSHYPTSNILLTKKGNPVVVDAVNQHTKEVQRIAKLARSKKNTPAEQQTPSSEQPQGLERNDVTTLKSKVLKAKSHDIAISLAHQARTKNEKIDALTYSHLPEAHMQDLHIGTKVVSKNGTPGIIKKLPSKENNMGKNTIIVSYYWFDDKWGKHKEEVKTKIGEFKCVREPEKYLPKSERKRENRST